MKLNFYQKLALLFFIFFVGIGVIGFLALQNNAAFVKSNKWVEHTQLVLNESEKIFALTQSIASGERGYVITGDSAFLQPFIAARQNIFVQIVKLRSLTSDNPVQQQRIDSIRLYSEKRIDIANQIVGAMNNGDRAKATRIIIGEEGKRQSVIVRKYVSELQEDENALLKQRKASNEESMETFNHLLWILFAGLLILLTLSYFGFRYNHIRQIKLEGQIKASNHFLSTILENIPNMIFIKDAVLLRFVRFNRAGEILLGINREELIGKNDYDLFPREQADAFVSKDKEVLVKGILQDIPEEAISTPEGERWLHTKKIPINDETGNPKYLLGISEDIPDSRQYLNEIKKLNAQLEATVNKLISANKEMEAFTYSVSHDLRAPLRIIDGFGEILLKDYGHSLDDEGKQTLGVIMSNAKHMGQLIDDLLNLSRLGRTPLSIKMVDMHKIVEDVIQAMNVMTPHVAKANIKINPISVCECDSSLARQVWINLISNAVKYSSKEDCPLIEIGSENKNGLNVYYVKDNGVGFDMRYYNKLFGVFQRLHKLSEFEGTGIGLALVHRIITKHGGKIWAEAVENEGAVFYFTLRV